MLGSFYKQRVFEEIGSLVGKVARLDIKTDSGTNARMAVYVDLKKSFNLCPSIAPDQCTENGNAKSSTPMVEGSTTAVGEEPFGPWMIVEQRSHQNQKDTRNQKVNFYSKGRNSRRDRTLSKTIRGSGGHFKVLGNSHVPLPETMTSVARLIGSQPMLEAYRTE
ncbi:hypothetical protein PVK06_019524 [Gossypium arboreum]|uniref:Uncharacterized protein n=1 Tax=Gossypium arboreum TaxID=29729 RepID=A0ABR0PK90_GOSAR|nr:hypothetical protein PVK06_019524 [Gossypium arboreum]